MRTDGSSATICLKRYRIFQHSARTTAAGLWEDPPSSQTLFPFVPSGLFYDTSSNPPDIFRLQAEARRLFLLAFDDALST